MDRKALLENANPAFIVFEGACPVCFEDVEEKDKGLFDGEANEYTNDFDWYEFICPNGHETYVEKTAGGDWATSRG